MNTKNNKTMQLYCMECDEKKTVSNELANKLEFRDRRFVCAPCCKQLGYKSQNEYIWADNVPRRNE